MAKMVKEFNKVTTGFVTQKFKLIKGKYICVSQIFTASDSVDFEDTEFGENIINPTLEMQNAYQNYEMIQPPKNKS